MSDHDTTFGDLRSHLARPSAHNWAILLDALERWRDREELHHVVLPYVDEHLDRSWPIDLREVPRDALAACLDDAPPAWLPLCRSLTLQDSFWTGLGTRAQRIERLVPSPLIAHIAHLGCMFTDGGARLVLDLLEAADALGDIAALDLTHSALDRATLTALLAHPKTQRLRELDLSLNDALNEPGTLCATLGPSPQFQALTYLGLSRLDLDDILELFAQFGFPAQLKTLRLAEVGLDADDIARLAEAADLGALEELWLYNNTLDVPALDALARAMGPDAAMTSLMIHRCDIDDESATALAAWGHTMPRLRHIRLDNNLMTRVGLEICTDLIAQLEVFSFDDLPVGHLGDWYRTWPGFGPRLDELYLHMDEGLGDDELRAFAERPGWPALRSLILWPQQASGDGLRALFQSRALTALESLSVNALGTCDASPEPFWPRDRLAMPRLRELDLAYIHNLPSAVIDDLARSPQLGTLRALAVSEHAGSSVMSDTLIALADAPHFALRTVRLGGHRHDDEPALIEALERRHCRLLTGT